MDRIDSPLPHCINSLWPVGAVHLNRLASGFVSYGPQRRKPDANVSRPIPHTPPPPRPIRSPRITWHWLDAILHHTIHKNIFSFTVQTDLQGDNGGWLQLTNSPFNRAGMVVTLVLNRVFVHCHPVVIGPVDRIRTVFTLFTVSFVPSWHVQDDHLACAKPPVDIKT